MTLFRPCHKSLLHRQYLSFVGRNASMTSGGRAVWEYGIWRSSVRRHYRGTRIRLRKAFEKIQVDVQRGPRVWLYQYEQPSSFCHSDASRICNLVKLRFVPGRQVGAPGARRGSRVPALVSILWTRALSRNQRPACKRCQMLVRFPSFSSAATAVLV